MNHGLCINGKVHPVARAWYAMRERCNTENHPAFKNYGGRGITICERWGHIDNFIEDMFPTWLSGLTIERVDNNKGYSPENCVWAGRKEQANNRRSNKAITFNGVTLTVAQWAQRMGIRKNTLVNRLGIRGWPIERALTTP